MIVLRFFTLPWLLQSATCRSYLLSSLESQCMMQCWHAHQLQNLNEAIGSIRSKTIQSQVESDTLVCNPSVSDYALHYTLLTLFFELWRKNG